MKKLLLVLLCLPIIGFGQNYLINCNNGYFTTYCNDNHNCELGVILDPNLLTEQESDSTSVITWISLTNEESAYYFPLTQVNNSPGIDFGRFSSLVLSNDDVYTSSGYNPIIKKTSPSQNQFNIDLANTNIANIDWQTLDTLYSSCTNNERITKFCEGLNEEIFFAYCENGMTTIAKIVNDSAFVLVDSISGTGVKSIAFFGNSLYFANSAGVFKYESGVLSDLNSGYISTLELDNNGIPHVVTEDTITGYGEIRKYLNNSWVKINNSYDYFVGDPQNYFDFDSNNNGYFLVRNISTNGLNINIIENDSVLLFNNFYPTYNMQIYEYALEIDNYDNIFVTYTSNQSSGFEALGLIKFNGTNWSTILNENTPNPGGSFHYMDLQFNSNNDLYLMYSSQSHYPTVITFCNCDLQPNNQSYINEQTTNKELLKVTDLLGRETKGSKNEPLFYIYDDGTAEKKITID